MEPPQKILTVTPFFPPSKGGVPNHVFQLTKNLFEKGKTLSLITPKLKEKTSQYYLHFKNVYEIPSFSLPGWPYPTLRSVKIPKDFGSKIKSIIRNGDFDVIHVHGHHYPFSWNAVKAAKKYGIPTILTLHGMYALNPNVVGGKTTIENMLNKYHFQKTFAKINGVIGLTNEITNYSKIFTNGATKYFTIANGVDVNTFKENLKRKDEYRKNYNIKSDSTVILFRGRFEHVKGIIEFARAAKKIIKNENIEIVIVGGGSLNSSLREILEETDRIHIFDWQPEEKIHELYITSDIFIIPSRFEALPIAIMEAMNAGLYIVYSPVGGVPDILENYPRKTFLKDISPNAIETVLSKVISNLDTEKISQSLEYAGKFDWRTIANDTYKAYSECISPLDFKKSISRN